MENSLEGGFGSAVMALLHENGIDTHVERMGIPDKFIEQGSQQLLRKNIGLDKEGIKKKIRKMMADA